MYVDAKRLVALIEQAQAEGRVGDELAELVSRIARGVWWLHRPGDPDDFRQECVMRFLRAYRTIDTSRGPRSVFSWISEVCLRYGAQAGRNEAARRRHVEQYLRHLQAADEMPVA